MEQKHCCMGDNAELCPSVCLRPANLRGRQDSTWATAVQPRPAAQPPAVQEQLWTGGAGILQDRDPSNPKGCELELRESQV